MNRLLLASSGKSFTAFLCAAISFLVSHSSYAASPKLGSKKTFWVRNYFSLPGEFRQAKTTLKSSGARTLIYVEDSLWQQSVSQEYVEQLQKNLDSAGHGIVPQVEKLFAPLPAVAGKDQKLQILLTDLSPKRAHWVDGFFDPLDQLRRIDAEKLGSRSNQANLIYINVPAVEEDLLSSVVAREMQKLVSYRFSMGQQDLWLARTLSEAAILATGAKSGQQQLDAFSADPNVSPLVSRTSSHRGPAIAFASYLLDSHSNKEEAMGLLTKSTLKGRAAVEALFRRYSNSPINFDVIFSNFLGYVFQNQYRQVPYTLSPGLPGSGLNLGFISSFTRMNAFPAEMHGQLMPYSFLAIDLSEALPPTALVEVEVLRDGAAANSCGGRSSVLWKPINPRRIAIYSVGCEHRNQDDLLQFRLRIFHKPLHLPLSPLKIGL